MKTADDGHQQEGIWEMSACRGSHMIARILSISNVGRFLDCRPGGDISFTKLTLIYAENGRGKTTFSAILRSLQTGDGRHIVERRTLGQAGPPKVELRLASSNVAFSSGKWDSPMPDIELFDAEFIHDNMYAGLVVTHAHKKNLYNVLVGSQSVSLAKTISLLDRTIRLTKSQRGELRSQIEDHIIAKLPFETFVSLTCVEDVEKKIQAKELELAAAQQAQAIADTGSLAEITLPTLPDVKRILSRTLNDISADAEALLNKQIKDYLDEDGETWLSQGCGYCDKGRCPFCGASTTGNTLFEAYRSYFSGSYAELKSEIADATAAVEADFGETALVDLVEGLEANASAAKFWAGFVNTSTLATNNTGLRKNWERVKKAVLEHLSRKAKAPLDTVEANEELEAAMFAYQASLDSARRWNESIKSVNAAIEAKKTGTATANASSIQAELLKLKNVPKRFEANVDSLCQQYTKANANATQYEREKAERKEELDKLSDTLMRSMGGKINSYLEKFQAGFRIGGLEASYVGGSPNTNYHLEINGQNVDLGDAETTGRPCFRNTLSAGDKSALALAFFLARLDNEKRLGEKVVVLDDPMSSQDRFRSSVTVAEICRLTSRAAQVIVMSHNADFLAAVGQQAAGIAQPKVLEIASAGGSSTIVPLDMDSLTRSSYQENFLRLLNYEKGASKLPPVDVANAIRLALEGSLRMRFPDQFTTGWLGSFLKQIREAEAGHPLAVLQPELPELSEINEYARKFHHEPTLGATPARIDTIELGGYVSRTIKMLRGAKGQG